MDYLSKQQMTAFEKRIKTIRRKAENLMCDVMDAGEPETSNRMQLSDWAQNVVDDCDSALIDIEIMRKNK